jgi:hypothetical protein
MTGIDLSSTTSVRRFPSLQHITSAAGAQIVHSVRPKYPGANMDESSGKRVSAIMAAGLAVVGTTTVTWIINHFLEKASHDEKVLQVLQQQTPNLASLPEGLAKTLVEVRLSIGPDKWETVHTLFSYQVTVTNQSPAATAENISLYVVPPTDVTYIQPPIINTTPKTLATFIQKNVEVVADGVHYTLAYLQPRQSVTYSFVGYSVKSTSDIQLPSADVQARDWRSEYPDLVEILDPGPPAEEETLYEFVSNNFVALVFMALFYFMLFSRHGSYYLNAAWSWTSALLKK